MPMCWANSPMERPSSPRVVASSAAASKITRRLSAPSVRGFRWGRSSPSHPSDPNFMLVLDIAVRFLRLIDSLKKSSEVLLDIIARPYVLFKERPIVLLGFPSWGPRSYPVCSVQKAAFMVVPRLPHGRAEGPIGLRTARRTGLLQDSSVLVFPTPRRARGDPAPVTSRGVLRWYVAS